MGERHWRSDDRTNTLRGRYRGRAVMDRLHGRKKRTGAQGGKIMKRLIIALVIVAWFSSCTSPVAPVHQDIEPYIRGHMGEAVDALYTVGGPRDNP